MYIILPLPFALSLLMALAAHMKDVLICVGA
jgi:hypothetical protein